MEVDLTQGSQMIYVIPEVMMTIGDFYRNIQISILARGYEACQNSEANLLITRGMVGRLSNTPNIGFAYEVQGVVDYLTSHGVNALPGRSYDIPETYLNSELPPPFGWGDEEIDEFSKPRSPEGKQARETSSERYSSITEPLILINKISPNAVTPTRHTEGYAGLDIAASHAAVIEPYGRDIIHIGLRIEIPYGYYGRLASRSGLAWKTGIEVGAGVIDSDYRGEVQVLLFNRTNLPIYISQQQKIVQLILEKIAIPEVYEIPHLSYTERETKGFGSTENQHTLAENQASTSQSPRYFTTQDIFSLLLPRETATVLVQDDSGPNNFEKAHAVDTSPGASVPRSMETTQNYEDTDNSYLDYIQYLCQLSTKTKPLWDTYPDSDFEWTNPFASEVGYRCNSSIRSQPPSAQCCRSSLLRHEQPTRVTIFSLAMRPPISSLLPYPPADHCPLCQPSCRQHSPHLCRRIRTSRMLLDLCFLFLSHKDVTSDARRLHGWPPFFPHTLLAISAG
ncbi:hypothetical protein ZIOFF_019040 [Zingiber officinale]|uniref:dUTP diphosphatase n=1 Tax=Zingiber officinale TaxID=94328 RepID=A0A8J5HDP5_ZINOF|nr:hypothetical protein ZIOFF_019040 [Zingiber officinale]